MQFSPPPPSGLVRNLFGKTPEKRHFAEQVPKNVRTRSERNEHKEARAKTPFGVVLNVEL